MVTFGRRGRGRYCCLLAISMALLLAITTTLQQQHYVEASQSANSKSRSKCSIERDQEMDTCASQMGFLGNHLFRLPKNVTSMAAFCQELKNSIACIQQYSRQCLLGFTKQILNSLLKRGKQQHNLICHDDQAKRDFLQKMNCLSDNRIGQLHSCMDASVARFEYIRSSVRPEFRLPALCCSYQVFNRDLDTTMDRVCGPRGGGGGGGGQGEEGSGGSDGGIHEFMHKVVGGTTGEFFQLVCDNHRTMAECQASDKTRDTLKRLEQVTRATKQGKIKPKSKSLIPVLLDILDSSEPV